MTQAVGKIWGFDITILERPHFQMHEIQFEKGGVCSEHLHAHRYNAFYCIRGALRVSVWNNETRPDVIDLMPTQMTIVPPGVFHQFEGITDGAAIEVYWVDDPDPFDIHRRTEGFKREAPKAEPEKTLVH